jgi:hypothetical protein
MSGISPTNSLPNGGLSSVGASLESSGAAPTVTPAAPAATSAKQTPYQTEFQTLRQQDTAELLYASFLSSADGLANANSVLQQAASLLGTPGQPGSTVTYTPTSTSTASTANLPSVSSILAASDEEANQTLANYANAPAGSSILDVQA